MAIDWQSPAEIAIDSEAFTRLQHALLGLYAWEWLISLDFDWEIFSGRKKFRWPMAFYFLNRYMLLFALIGIVISMNVRSEVDCQALYTFNQIAGQACAGLASINLCLRTIAVYHNSKWIAAFLCVLSAGHWSLILQGILLTAHWDPTLLTCVITKTNTVILSANFIYTMAFDLIVLLLNAYRLASRKNDASVGATRLGRLIFSDGLIYFFIAFVSNLVATIFMLLNLNAIMSVIFNVPAVIASTIVACRAVRRLSNFANAGPEIFSSDISAGNTAVRFRPMGPAANPTVRRSYGGTTFPQTSVHVQMETFTRQEDGPMPFHIDNNRLEEAKRMQDSEKDLEQGSHSDISDSKVGHGL